MAEPVRFQHFEVPRRGDGSLHELGRGAMGVTYKAFDTNLRCFVALKVINASCLGNDVARQRFVREARAAAALRHPNVATVFHLGEEGEDWFYAMEYVDGETVEALVKREGTISTATALRMALQVAKALGAAGKQGLVHRDIKPSNLMVVREDDSELAVKVIDFGLAKTSAGGGESAALTLGGFLGTPHFASPEQLEERDLDARSDIYSLGVTLYYMLAGRVPFGGSLAQVMGQHLHREPPLEALAGQPHPVLDLLRKMLAKDPAERQQTPADLRREIEACLDPISGAVPVADESFETQAIDMGPATAFDVTAGGATAAASARPPSSAQQRASVEKPDTAAPPATFEGERRFSGGPAGIWVAGFLFLLAVLAAGGGLGYLKFRRPAAAGIVAAPSPVSAPTPVSFPAPTAVPAATPIAAATPDADAQLLLGRQLRETDPSAALKWFLAAANNGSTAAMVQAGLLLSNGHGGREPDLPGAAAWFERAALKGDPAAMFLLAECCLGGKGVTRDPRQAIELLQKAVEKNDPASMNRLGDLYKKGVPGVLEPDFKVAFGLFSRAVELGYDDALGNLGVLHIRGEGTDKNEREGLALIQQGVAKGNGPSLCLYAMCLEQGIAGVEINGQAARRMYIGAARAGNVPAQQWCREKNISFGEMSAAKPDRP